VSITSVIRVKQYLKSRRYIYIYAMFLISDVHVRYITCKPINCVDVTVRLSGYFCTRIFSFDAFLTLISWIYVWSLVFAFATRQCRWRHCFSRGVVLSQSTFRLVSRLSRSSRRSFFRSVIVIPRYLMNGLDNFNKTDMEYSNK